MINSKFQLHILSFEWKETTLPSVYNKKKLLKDFQLDEVQQSMNEIYFSFANLFSFGLSLFLFSFPAPVCSLCKVAIAFSVEF